mmetsp:Transcript_18591/g.32274  ORF Transcript_18591/g.32274 Transcript_18591/m.32274 type:complete len:150 (-) Transcript_18591:1141-1590(-)
MSLGFVGASINSQIGVSSFVAATNKCPASRRQQPVAARWSMLVTEVESKVAFETAIKSAGNALVVIDFSTTWCGPCKIIAPKFEKMSEDYTNVVFLKVVGDKTGETNQLMRESNIRSVPAFHYYKNGQKVYEVTGAKVEAIEAGIKSHM